MSEKIKKELEKNKKLKELEDSREDKFLKFIPYSPTMKVNGRKIVDITVRVIIILLDFNEL